MQHCFPALAIFFTNNFHFAAHDKKHLFHVVVDVRRPDIARRYHHGRKREVRRGHRVHVGGHAGAAGADVTHLRAAIPWVVISLKFERVPIIFAGGKAGDARVHPVREALAGRSHHAALDVSFWRNGGVHQSAFVKNRFVGCCQHDLLSFSS